MSNNISLNKVKNSAFLANQSYETFKIPEEGEKIKITNPTTNSSFQVMEQTNEYTALK